MNTLLDAITTLGQNYLYFFTIATCWVVIGIAANNLISKFFKATNFIAPNLALSLLFNYVSGTILFTLLLFIFGLCGVFYFQTIITGLLVLTLVSIVYLWRYGFLGRHSYDDLWPQLKTLAPILALWLAFLVVPYAPVNRWDDAAYHLPYARYFVEQHAILINPYLLYPYLPQHTHLLYAFALLLRDEILAQTIHSGFAFVTVIGAYGIGLYLTRSTTAGYLAAILYLMAPFMKKIIGVAYVDHALAMYGSAAIAALCCWENSRHPVWIALAGIAMGGAIGTKYFGVPLAIVLVIWLFWSAKNFRQPLIFLLLMLITGGGWYIRNYWLVGNPVHPIAGSIFGYGPWNETDWALQTADQFNRGVNSRNILLLPWLLIRINCWPLLLSLASVIFWKRFSNEIRFSYTIFVSYVSIWFLFSQGDRYLAPVLPIGYLLAYVFLWEAFTYIPKLQEQYVMRYLERSITAIMLVGAVVLFYINAKEFLRLTEKGFDTELRNNNSGYAIMLEANKYHTQYGDRLYTLGFSESIYYHKGTTIGQIFGLGRYSQMLDDWLLLKPPEIIKDRMRYFNANLLAVSREFELDEKIMNIEFQLLYENSNGWLFAMRNEN